MNVCLLSNFNHSLTLGPTVDSGLDAIDIVGNWLDTNFHSRKWVYNDKKGTFYEDKKRQEHGTLTILG